TAKSLDCSQMIRFDDSNLTFHPTKMGRVASHFYLKHATVDTFNQFLKPVMYEDEILDLLCQSGEFKQIKCRDEEMQELFNLSQSSCYYKKDDDCIDSTRKVNILIQSIISR
ncbi:MAG: hypothetical protein MHPSP_004599, partial [Paramarteilia canceri]